jgi:hypothetical protein
MNEYHKNEDGKKGRKKGSTGYDTIKTPPTDIDMEK